MKIYLVQHGKAKTKEEDINRPLNLTGIEQTKNVAQQFIKKNFDKPAIIFCSKKLRAKQTAEILADFIKPEKGIREEENLNPDDDPAIWIKKIDEITENIMIVGHLPHLKKLSSLLVFNNLSDDSIQFVNSGIVCLEKKEEKWIVLNIITAFS